MREIKFRAWLLNEKRMHHIDGFYDPVMSYNDEETCISMQYTGLEDKNGKKIYSDDVVTLVVNVIDGYDPMLDTELNHDETLKYKVEIDEDIIRTKLIPITENDDPFGCNDYAWYLTDTEDEFEIEIIGNIHENPELL